MKELKIDYYTEGYSPLVNNCLDYNIAGAFSFFNKEFLSLYCSLWTLFTNYSSLNNEEIRKEISNLLGLRIESCDIVQKNNIINIIKHHIDNNEPLILNTNTALLFYSSMYKENTINIVNHSIIIYGYDDEKELIKIKENSINSELLRLLLKSQPFSSYQITYEMITNIINDTIKYLENNNILKYIKYQESISLTELKIKIINTLKNMLLEDGDYIINKIINGNKHNNVDTFFVQEEFYRSYLHSFNPLLDFIADYYNINNTNEYKEIKNSFINERYKVFLVLTKNAYKQNLWKKVDKITLISSLKMQNQRLLNFIINHEHQTNCDFNLLSNVKIKADSKFDDMFSVKNVFKDEIINDNLCFWKSSNFFKKHWIIIEFENFIEIGKILIENRSHNLYITRSYDIYVYQENGKEILLKKIQNNNQIINEIILAQNLKINKIKILINIPNSGIDFAARLKRIRIYKKNDDNCFIEYKLSYN